MNVAPDTLNNPRGGKRFFYGWVIVLACTLLQFCAVGVLNNTLSLFIIPVSTDFGVTRSAFSLYNSFGMISGLFAAPLWGEVFQKRRMKPFMIGGAAFMSGVAFLYSYATAMWHFYALAFVNGLVSMGLVGAATPKLLGNWFVEKRGTATGIAMAGSGLGGMLMLPIVSAVIEASGWRAGYRTIAVVFTVIILPTMIFLIKERPEDVGQSALGAVSLKEGARPQVPLYGMTRKQMLRSKTARYYALGTVLTVFSAQSIHRNMLPYFQDLGYTSAFAANMNSLYLGVLIFGKMLLGRIYDKYGAKAGTVYSCITLSLTALAMSLSSKMPLPIVSAFLFGLGCAVWTMQIPYLTQQLFGNREYSRIYGTIQPINSIAGAIATPLMSAVYDFTGSYRPTFVFSIFSPILLGFCILRSITLSKKELADCEAVNTAEPSAACAEATA